jgi:inosine-uridine nucleoside N-ribohydrolase
MKQDDEGLLRRLRKPSGPVDVALDTDTYNEVDDQYALAFLIKSPEKLRLKAIYAAPFYNSNVLSPVASMEKNYSFYNTKSSSPADGMEKSYSEILKILSLMGRGDLQDLVKKGSGAYLPSETEAVISPAAQDLAERAMTYSEDKPLYVIAIGAITNIASALLLRPEIKDRIVIIWLGGHAFHWPNNREFNIQQDVAAARVVFDSGAAVVLLPCMGVISSFYVTGPELDYWLRGKNPLCDYLISVTAEHARENQKIPTWAKVIWDVCAVAWLLDGDYMLDRLEPSPVAQYDHHYSFDPNRHFIRYVYYIKRPQLIEALFRKLSDIEK